MPPIPPRPNPRLQRTRLRAPLSRKPLGRFGVMLISAILCSGTMTSATPALLDSDQFVALQDDHRLFLLDKSGPAWFVFDLTVQLASFSADNPRRAPADDPIFLIDGKRVRFVRFKGVLVFPGDHALIGRQPSFELHADNGGVDEPKWNVSQQTNSVVITEESQARQVRLSYTLSLPKQ